MGIVRIAFAWLAGALAVSFAHVTWADDLGPGKEVRAIRHDAAIVIGERMGTPVSIDRVAIDGDHAVVDWRDATVIGRDEFDRMLGLWVDTKRDPDSVHALVGVTFDSDVGPFTISARMPSESESWRNRMLHGGGNAYAFFNLQFENDGSINVPNGTNVTIWLPYVPPSDIHYELTFAHAAAPLEPVYGSVQGCLVRFRLPPFTIPPHAELIGELDGN